MTSPEGRGNGRARDWFCGQLLQSCEIATPTSVVIGMPVLVPVAMPIPNDPGCWASRS